MNPEKPPGDLPPERVGPYHLEKPIGAGGMGTVWRAWDERLRRRIAVKQVRLGAVQHARERLRREARAVARLNHPAIVQIYDLVEASDCDWIVMELVEGRPLNEMIAAGRLPVLSVLQIGGDVASGLAEAHSHGVLHRDLKTNNVMVTAAGRAKILDFGIAKELEEDEDPALPDLSLSAPGVILGTCHAMSPEQVLGHDLDARSDLFSLGSLLYEALSGASPFRGRHPRETLGRVLHLRPAPLAEIRPEIPRQLSDLVARLLEKNRERRPGAAGEVSESLAALSAALATGTLGREVPSGATAMTGELTLEWPSMPISSPISAPHPAGTQSASGARAQFGERRRVTVVCCGLAGGKDGSGEDLEALSEALGDLRERARARVEPLGGSLGALVGGVVWFYFGYPQVHEDDALRAVRVARALVDPVELGPAQGAGRHSRPALCAAVHSGPAVVAHALDGTVDLQLGGTLDLASGLLRLAEPDSVVVSGESYPLVARGFALEALPAATLPGFSRPIPRYRILTALGRDDASSASSPLVGRDRELDLLFDRFRLARSGEGQAVMIGGEAGIGKSRLVRALRERLSEEAALLWLVGYGSPYTRSSPFAPMIEILERLIASAAGASGMAGTPGTPGDTPEERLRGLEGLLRRSGLPLEETLPLLAPLLGLPAERDLPLPVSADVRREKTLEIFVALLAELAERHPVILVIEDLHWIDPSTLELLDRLLGAISGIPLLLVGTFRSEFQPTWKHGSQVTQIGLSRLTDDQTASLIERLDVEQDLPAPVRRQIVAKTDGVPLFVEELIRAVIESEWSEAEPEIPSTLYGSLMARLDRLGRAKEVAQLASVIGRVFTLELLVAIASLEESLVRSGLEELVRADLVRRRGVAAKAIYVFKHALIQDAAYLSLLKKLRQQIHRQIGEILEERLSGGHETEPEIVAYHFDRAGLPLKAVPYLQQAALRSIQRSAFSEALSHGRRGIELLADVPPSPETRELELGLRSLLGVALIPTQGYASPEVEENAQKSEALCREIGDTPRLLPSLYGLWVYHLLRGHRQESRALAEEIGRLPKTNDEERFIAFSSLGITRLYEGELQESREALEAAMALYRPELQARLAETYGDESGLLPHVYCFWCVWLLGEPDEALRRMEETRAIILGLPSPYVRVTFFLFEMILWHALRRPEEVRRVAEQFVALSREQRFPFFLALASCGYGWTAMHRGDPEGGIAQIREALATHQAIGTMLPRAYWLTYLIEVCLAAGRIEEGLAAVEEGLTLSETQLDVFYDAELYRLRGELLARRGDVSGAEAAFREALAIAERQGARALALRAAADLADARELLQP